MKAIGQVVAALAGLAFAANALAVSSSVRIDGLSVTLTDLDPNDGIAAALVADPSFDYFYAGQSGEVGESMGFDFRDLARCPEGCPIFEGQAEIYAKDATHLAGRTLSPGSLYLDLAPGRGSGVVGVTPATRVTIRANGTFNDGLAGPLGTASLDLGVVGYSLFPDRVDRAADFDRASSGEGGLANLEVSFVNSADRLAPMHYLTSMFVFGRSPVAPPIPEPQTYALFAVGLAALVWQTRRRRAQSRPARR